MRTGLRLTALACTTLVCVSAIVLARPPELDEHGDPHSAAAPSSRTDTLWIFDADFEDLLGDNAGWATEDLSGVIACSNYWHKDTIRINGFTHLGDSTWWCGKYDDCWIQPRGYGNNWTCILSRSFPDLEAAAQPGDVLVLEYDQRYAIESCYDYAYTDISTDGGETWTTRAALSNASCAFHPGISLDWDDDYSHIGARGHMEFDLSDYAGQPLDLRFRFESDFTFSSQDRYNNPVTNPMLDGAWQIDNVAWYINDELFWLDDCESPGQNGWVTEDWPASGQTGVVYRRSYEEFNGHAGWMMVACDTVSSEMVAGQLSRLYSPPIDVAGASELVVTWDGWVDLPGGAAEYVTQRHRLSDGTECIERHLPQEGHYDWTLTGEGPVWMSFSDTSSFYYSGQDWLGLIFEAGGADVAGSHGVGIAFDRIRVGIPLETGAPDGDLLSDEIRAIRPNPFNPRTTVEFTVAREGRASLRVYDIAGRFVTTLKEGELPPGDYETSWDGTSDSGERVASGVYMLRLEVAGGRPASTKAVLLE
jgi:hypothetical protein